MIPLLLAASGLWAYHLIFADEDISTMSDQKFYSRIDEFLSLLLDGARTAHEKGHPNLAPFCAFLSEARIAAVRATFTGARRCVAPALQRATAAPANPIW